MPLYQRITVPQPDFSKDGVKWHLYGFVELNPDKTPVGTHCCSLTPSYFVHAVGWSLDFPEDWDQDRQDEYSNEANVGEDDSGYYDRRVLTHLHKEAPWEAENDDEAREEASGNW